MMTDDQKMQLASIEAIIIRLFDVSESDKTIPSGMDNKTGETIAIPGKPKELLNRTNILFFDENFRFLVSGNLLMM